MRHAAKPLAQLDVPASAHRTPDKLLTCAASAEKRGLVVLIAGAGGAAHLHDYAKARRPGRKVGHATVTAENGKNLADGISRLTALAKAANLHAEAM